MHGIPTSFMIAKNVKIIGLRLSLDTFTNVGKYEWIGGGKVVDQS